MNKMIPIIIDIGLVKSVTTLTNPMVLQELNSDHYSVFFMTDATIRENTAQKMYDYTIADWKIYRRILNKKINITRKMN